MSETDAPKRESDVIPIEPRRSPRRDLEEWRRYAEDEIEEAMARGDFENLPGRGKPLAWDTARDDEHWLANHLLKNSGFMPSWIEDRKGILRLREELEAWRVGRVEDLSEAGADIESEDSLERVDRFVAEYRERATALNDKIRRFNLTVPTDSVQAAPVAVERGVGEIHAALGLDQESAGRETRGR